MKQFKLVAEYSNETIDLNCFGMNSFTPDEYSHSRSFNFLNDENFNNVENGEEQSAIQFSGKIVFKTDSNKTAQERLNDFLKFFGKNTTKSYKDLSLYVFDEEPVSTFYEAYYFKPADWNYSLPKMTTNLVQKTKLICVHDDGEERFSYVMLESMTNIQNFTTDIVAQVVFSLSTLWLKKINLKLTSSFGESETLTATEFGDVGECIASAKFQPKNFVATDKFTLTASGKSVVFNANSTLKTTAKHDYFSAQTLVEDTWEEGAKYFTGEKFGRFSITTESGSYWLREAGTFIRDCTATFQNGYQFLNVSSKSLLKIDALHPTIVLTSDRNLQNLPSTTGVNKGMDGEIYYFAKYFEA